MRVQQNLRFCVTPIGHSGLSANGGKEDRFCICAALHSPFTYQLIAVKRPQWELEGTRLGPEAGKFGNRNKSGVCGIMQPFPRKRAMPWYG
jgi:hypothetical protein